MEEKQTNKKLKPKQTNNQKNLLNSGRSVPRNVPWLKKECLQSSKDLGNVLS